MKKKIFFIISAILTAIIATILIFNADSIIASQIESFKAMGQNAAMERTINMLQGKGKNILIVESILIILLNIFILETAITNKILRRKGLMITAVAVSFFCANHFSINLLCIAGLIILICSPRTNPEDFPPKVEDKPIPTLEYKKSSVKEIIAAIILILVYFSQFILDRIIPGDMPRNGRYAIVIAYYVIVLLTAIICFKDRYKRDIKLFKDNYRSYMKFILPIFGLSLLAMILLNMICLRITNQGTSVNQESINAMPKWFSLPLAVLWAPIAEEAVFRGAIRRFIKNDILFIIISAVAFGLIHTTNEINVFNKIVMAIPYASLGGFLAYMYAKSKNILTNTTGHFLHNLLASIIGLLV